MIKYNKLKIIIYISNFEKKELNLNNNLDNNNLNKMEALVIDVLFYPLAAINSEDFNTFFTLFEPIKHTKVMATQFTHQSFSHSFINKEKHLFNDIKLSNAIYTSINLDLFAYIAIKQYLFD